jgi:hypothetical protein
MPKYHVLDAAGGNPVNTAAVAHVTMPTGNNDADTPWKTCYLASFGTGAPATRLVVGNSPGKISQQEANQITSGDLLEIPFIFSDTPTAPLGDRQALLSTLGQRAIDEYLTLFSARFKLYGYTQAT